MHKLSFKTLSNDHIATTTRPVSYTVHTILEGITSESRTFDFEARVTLGLESTFPDIYMAYIRLNDTNE